MLTAVCGRRQRRAADAALCGGRRTAAAGRYNAAEGGRARRRSGRSSRRRPPPSMRTLMEGRGHRRHRHPEPPCPATGWAAKPAPAKSWTARTPAPALPALWRSRPSTAPRLAVLDLPGRTPQLDHHRRRPLRPRLRRGAGSLLPYSGDRADGNGRKINFKIHSRHFPANLLY